MDDLKNTLFKITKTVSKTSGDLIKSTKLSMSLASEEDNLKKLYMDIGKKVHEIYQFGGSLGKFFDEQYVQIVDCEGRIAELKEKLNLVKGTRACPKCGKDVEKTAEFCSKCGARMDAASTDFVDAAAVTATRAEPEIAQTQEQTIQSAPVPESVPAPIQTPAAAKRCDSCGAENDTDTKFCLNCGRYIY